MSLISFAICIWSDTMIS